MTSAAHDDLVRWIADALGEQLAIDPRTIDVHERFSRYGLDSLGAIALVRRLTAQLGRPISPVVVWRYPTPYALAEQLSIDATTALAAEPAAADPAAEPARPAAGSDEPIAILGMACRFPGAPSLAGFWQLLQGGVDAIRPVPPERWDATAWGDGGARWGGFVDHVDRFDPLFFGISPREAIAMDPQQRLMLELTWEALEHAGIVAETLKGSQTGVYVGSAWVDYARLVYQHGAPSITQHTVTGHHRSILANRLSYVFGLHGPSLSLDSACSSALVAVHLACEALLRGDATLALAGAVNLNLLPESTHGMTKFGALSPDGRCFTFDARANGYVRGEGGAVVVLKRLSRAIADGDPIACVIRGSAVNNDGASNGLTAPNPVAQEALLRAAYRRAQVTPDDVQYVELHGTGTQLGDPIEASALGAVLGKPRAGEHPLRVGSAKTNVGHLEGAAGMVGLVKAALCIQHRRLVPSLHFASPNPHIAFADLKLAVQVDAGPWPQMERALVAGVSSFGMGGTNAHVVLAEWPSPPVAIFPLAADSADALRTVAQRRLAALGASRDANQPWDRELSTEGSHRLALTARSTRELAQGLEDFLAGTPSLRVASGQAPDAPPKLVFVFAGQGVQWLGMGRSLLAREPVFRATLVACGALIQHHLGWSVLHELTADPASARLDHVEVGWPASIAVQLALTALLRSWGIEPAAVVGHSGGEIAAAYVAGALSLSDAMATICAYARMLARVRGRGAMGVVGLPWAAAAAALAGYEGRVFRAIQHGVHATVLAGEPDALDALFRALAQRDTFCRRLPVDVAPHCPLVAHLRAELHDAVRGVRPRAAELPIASAALGRMLPGDSFDAEHWVKNFCEPLAFSPAIDGLLDGGHDVFVEISPHPSTLYAIQSNLRHSGRRGALFPSLRRDEDEHAVLLDTLAQLYALGAPVRWDEVGPAGARSEAASPSTPASVPVPVPVALSAKTFAALRAQAEALAGHLAFHTDLRLRDVAHSLATTRTQFEQRAVVVASDRTELFAGLSALAQGTAAPQIVRGAVRGAGKLVFVFPGQGSQWPEMARPLLETSDVFRARIAACAGALAPHIDWSLLAVLRGEPGAPALDRVDVVQPVLFAVMVALAELWRHLGVQPDAVIGHSQGEIAAACVAGALSLEDAARIVARRSRALAQLIGRGTMALVELPAAELAPRLARFGAELAIAAINGPRATVVSGVEGALDALFGELEGAAVFARKIRVDYASHSPQVEAIAGELAGVLAGIRPTASALPVFSTVTGRALDGTALDAGYWYANLRQTVRFLDAVQAAVASGHAFFVEVSPHPVLTMALQDALAAADRAGAVVGSLRRGAGDLRQLLASAGELFAHGGAVDLRRLVPAGRRVALPTYAFQRERYWIEAPRGPRRRAGATRGLFGPPVSSSLDDGVELFDATVSTELVPYLADHVVDGRAILPGIAYAAMALDAAVHGPSTRAAAIDAVELHAVLDASPPAVRVVQLALIARGPGETAFRISSREDVQDESRDDAPPRWVLHASGVLRSATEPPATPEDLQAIQARCPDHVTGEAHYATLRAWRLAYGRGFAGVTSVWRGRDEALATVAVPELRADDVVHQIDPRWLDAALQVALALDPRYPGQGISAAVMPVGWRSLRVHDLPRAPRVQSSEAHHGQSSPAGEVVWSHARLRETHASIMTVDVMILDASGRVLIEMDGLRLQRLETSGDPVLRQAWRATERLAASQASDADPARVDRAGAVATRGSTPARTETAGDDHWILVGRGHLVDRVRAGLEARGQTVAVIDALELATGGGAPAHARLRDSLRDDRACRGVVHLAAATISIPDDVESMVAASEPVWASALHLVQALARHGWRDAPRLWLVTRGVQAVDDGANTGAAANTGASASLAGAPLLGLGRTLVYEHPELRCARLDLPAEPSSGDADVLVGELLAQHADDEVALRGDHRFTARLQSGPLAPRRAHRVASPSCEPASARTGERISDLRDPTGLRAAGDPAIRGDASYVVTGGFGGLGRSLARWLVEHGARRLVLASRSAPTEAVRTLASELEPRGATVVLATADVAQRADVVRLLHEADQLAPLGGVFHLAGVLEDGLVTQQDAARFRRVMAPKIDGAWHLHQLTRDRALDHFVLYSSIASLLGSPGQTNYAAANSFLDALALYRRAHQLPALSIGWGAFSEVGLAAARAVRGERLQDRGMASLSTGAGEAILASLLVRDEPWVGVVPLDVGRWLDFYPTLSAGTWFGDLIAAAAATPGLTGDAHRALVDKLRAAPAQIRIAQLESLVRHQLGRVLQCPPEAIAPHTPFTAIGLESLTGLELRNRIEAETGLRLPATIIWTRGNIASLARDLLDRLFPTAIDGRGPAAPPSAPASEPNLEALLSARAQDLSEDELLADLAQALDEAEAS